MSSCLEVWEREKRRESGREREARWIIVNEEIDTGSTWFDVGSNDLEAVGDTIVF